MPAEKKRRSALDEAAREVPGLTRRPESVARDRREDDAGKTWDERNRAHAFRIREVDAERLQALARDLGISKDAAGAALLQAALDAVDAGALTFEVDQVQSEVVDKRDRLRVFVKRRARPLWQSGALSEEKP